MPLNRACSLVLPETIVRSGSYLLECTDTHATIYQFWVFCQASLPRPQKEDAPDRGEASALPGGCVEITDSFFSFHFLFTLGQAPSEAQPSQLPSTQLASLPLEGRDSSRLLERPVGKSPKLSLNLIIALKLTSVSSHRNRDALYRTKRCRRRVIPMRLVWHCDLNEPQRLTTTTPAIALTLGPPHKLHARGLHKQAHAAGATEHRVSPLSQKPHAPSINRVEHTLRRAEQTTMRARLRALQAFRQTRDKVNEARIVFEAAHGLSLYPEGTRPPSPWISR